MATFGSEMTYNMNDFEEKVLFKDHCENFRLPQASLEGNPYNPEFVLICLSFLPGCWNPYSFRKTFLGIIDISDIVPDIGENGRMIKKMGKWSFCTFVWANGHTHMTAR